MGGGVRIVDTDGSPAALPDGGRVGFAFFAEVEELTLLAEKIPQGSSKGLAHRVPVQADLARSVAAVRGARAYVADEVGRSWDEVVASGRVTDERKVALRLAANAAAESALGAVDRCYTSAGGEAVYCRSPLQRVFRDIHVASQHAMVAARVYEPLGRFGFGLETETGGL
jgi:alkylation response protein AidB-like acyl-CoA dehydrogenase